MRDVFVDGELAATCWEPLADSGDPIDWREVGAIVRRVHALVPRRSPVGYPVPPPTAFPWWDFEALMADVGAEIDDAARAGLRARRSPATPSWRRLDGAHVVCHGDVHPGNVVMTADGPVLIDWDLMCAAPAGWDHAMLLTLAERWGGDAGAYPAFAAGYGESMADDVTTRRFAELRNVAATLMRVRAGRTDPRAIEAERRLRYWRATRRPGVAGAVETGGACMAAYPLRSVDRRHFLPMLDIGRLGRADVPPTLELMWRRAAELADNARALLGQMLCAWHGLLISRPKAPAHFLCCVAVAVLSAVTAPIGHDGYAAMTERPRVPTHRRAWRRC